MIHLIHTTTVRWQLQEEPELEPIKQIAVKRENGHVVRVFETRCAEGYTPPPNVRVKGEQP